jgi:hypothetical protein
MPDLHCTRCGLRIRIQASYLRIENCPRCLARSATVVPLAFGADDAQRPSRPRFAQAEELADEGAEQ